MMRAVRNIVIFLAVAGLFGGAAYYYRDAVGKTVPVHGHGHGDSHDHAHGNEAPVMNDAKVAAAGIELEKAVRRACCARRWRSTACCSRTRKRWCR